MRIITSLIFLLSVFFVTAQNDVDLNAPLPEDPQVSKGVLENGMTYYVRANDNPENRAELFLVVRAGSVDEDDDQQGLAHFAEHMAFNGTENFPKHELINYFESIGMEFGPEINAYTSFDETVYMLKVPLDTMEYMEQGLQVLYDWASQITDSDEEINNERGIIHEEWRGSKSAEERMQKQWWPVFLKDSKYAERFPIGKMEIVDNCPPEALRRYRNDWYRPDLQAVIVVGDFDQDEMVQKVKQKFSQIQMPENPREKEYYEIPDHKETLVKVVTDKEARYPLAYVMYKHDLEISNTVGDYRNMILENLYNAMINNRLAEKTQQADPPFIMGQSSYDELIGPKSAYLSIAVTQNGKIEDGIKAVLLENERVKKFGFTQTELERQKTALLNYIEKSYNERENQKSINYAEEYKRNFLLTKEPFPGIEKEFEYFKTFMPGITLEEVNELANQWIKKENRVVIVTAPEIEGVDVPTEEDIFALLDEVEKTEIEEYDDAVADVPLLAEEPAGNPVVAEKQLENVDAVEWTLQNGARVIIKPTDFKDDEILFNAWSPGGNSLYGLKDDISADFTADILGMSGIADFDNITLDKMLSDKVFSISPFVNQLREGFNGSSSVKDVETLLQMVYLYFTQPRFDETSYKSYLTRLAGVLENKSASPESAFQDTLQVTMAGYNKRARPMTTELLKEADFERIKEIGKERFKNASDFVFFFVGNINPETFKPLAEKYIGGIPASGEIEKWKNLHIETPDGVIEKVVKKGQDQKSIQYIVFHGDFDYNSKNRVELDAMGRILSTRLLEVIREEKSSVYSIGASPSSSKYPDEEYSVAIYYGTDPEKLPELKQAVFDEIKKFAENGPSKEELDKAKEKMLRERETAEKENSFWLSILSNTYYLKDGDFTKYGTYKELVDAMTIDSLKNAFQRYFNFDNYISVALAPAE
ncbi:M16 family metallopeptidase [Maribellus maritimus]|uniref:M16 family metallopeptidase n=1 Tax=Maribellus maritimus TaxID=2870838 RepID=UPI001EEA3975|nr:insulinase family protein [Maribellus maritimus]MCG6187660.1 insulinase family protein [Maribellus maritimus]